MWTLCDGHDYCDRCGFIRAVKEGYDFNIDDKLKEIYPDGKWGYYCEECCNLLG